jgi:hypothetical protein
MDLLSHQEKNGEKIRDFFWEFFLVWHLNIHNNKLVHDAKTKLGENIYISIHINVQEFKIWKFYNLKVYMHPRLYMYEHFDLIIDPFKYKCETSQIFKHPFQKILMNAKCNSQLINLTTFKMNDSTHVQMLIIQNMQKKSLTHSNINVRH